MSGSSSVTQRRSNKKAAPVDAEPAVADAKPIVATKSPSVPWSVTAMRALWSEVPAHSIVALRVAWGVVMLYEMTTYMNHDYQKTHRYLSSPEFQFRYWAFEWVPRLSLAQWQVFFPIMCAFSICFAIGLFYRLASIGFFVGFCVIYFQDIGLYLNHFYLIIVLNFVYCFLPANRFFALDSLIGIARYSRTVPYWAVWLSRFLISNVYVWAGIAKMNEDWIRCEPLISWVPAAHTFPPLKWLGMSWVQNTVEMACFMSWSGLLLDTFVPFFLSYRPTRMLAFLATMAFHITNKFMLNIGVFPYVMIGISFIYFDPDWPLAPYYLWIKVRRALAEPETEPRAEPAKSVVETKPSEPVAEPLAYDPNATTFGGVLRSLSLGNKAVMVFLFLVVCQQVLFPLRHFYYPGDVVWNEEGHRYSWRMKLRDKSGIAIFNVKSSVRNETVLFDPVFDLPFKTLTRKQSKKVAGRPDMIHLYARHLASMFEQKEGVRPEVRVFGVVSVNNRMPQLFVDPFVDLAAIEPWQWPNKWIVEGLPRGSFDWRVVPWPVCSHVPHEPNARYTRARLYEMYKGYKLADAQAAYMNVPPSDAAALRDCNANKRGGGPMRRPTKPRDDDADAGGD